MANGEPGTVTLNFSSIMIGTSQPSVLAEFYTKVFGRPADFSDESFSGWQVGGTFLMLGGHSDVSGQAKEPARMIMNFETPAVQDEFQRLARLGVTVVREPYEMGPGWIATLADPDGNFLQLMSPFEAE